SRACPPLLISHDTATPDIDALSLHDALPISPRPEDARQARSAADAQARQRVDPGATPKTSPAGASAARDPNVAGGPERANIAPRDRKSTRLNSSHVAISYAVFCLEKKNRSEE